MRGKNTEAANHLAYLRTAEGDISDSIVRFRGLLSRQGVSLEAVGTNADELQRLKLNGYRKQAERLLRDALTLNANVRHQMLGYLQQFDDYRRLARLEFSDFKIAAGPHVGQLSHGRFDQLMKLAHRYQAESCLSLLRAHVGNPEELAGYIQSHCFNAGISPHDLGMKPEEVRKLAALQPHPEMMAAAT